MAGQSLGASAHDKDYVGSAAFDHNDSPLGPFLSDHEDEDLGPLEAMARRARVPAGFRPVGFQLVQLTPDEKGLVRFIVMAASCETVGSSAQAMREYARRKGELPVSSFEGKLPVRDFRRLFKTIDISVASRTFADLNIRLYPSNEIQAACGTPRAGVTPET